MFQRLISGLGISFCATVNINVESFTCANEEHIIGLVCCRYSMNSDLGVANITFQQERLAADHAVHQKVVFDKV